MPIRIEEPPSFEAYEGHIRAFQESLRAAAEEVTATAESRIDFSESMERGRDDIRRFIAWNDAQVAGWMTLKSLPKSLKIEGMCVHFNRDISGGASKALVTEAVNCSLRSGRGGIVTLYNASRGTGDRLYEHMGFRPVDGNGNMRLDITYDKWETRPTGRVLRTKKGKELPVVALHRIEPVD